MIELGGDDRDRQLIDLGMRNQCYRIADPLRPVGHRTTLCVDLVRKWSFDVIDHVLEPVWPSQHHRVRTGPDGVERTVRIIYGPETHSIITRTVTGHGGNPARNSLDLQRQAFLAVGKNDPTLRWMPDGGRYLQGKTEIALIPPSKRHLLVTTTAATARPSHGLLELQCVLPASIRDLD